MNALNEQDEAYMRLALAEAQNAFELGEVPVGAVVVQGDSIIGSGYNQPITQLDPSAHAEMVALRKAAQTIGNYRLANTTLYVTVEPCSMCAGLLMHSRIQRLVYGAPEPKAGAITSAIKLLEQDFFNHRIEVCGSVLEQECSDMMTRFFAERRAAQKRVRQRANQAD